MGLRAWTEDDADNDHEADCEAAHEAAHPLSPDLGLGFGVWGWNGGLGCRVWDLGFRF